MRPLKDADRVLKVQEYIATAGGLKLILGPGVFTVFDIHKMDMPLFWKELARVVNLESRWSGCGWH
eukprot:1145786-Pelagomonas_calceolata.AAC.5